MKKDEYNSPSLVVKMMFQKTINRLTVFVKGDINSLLTSKIKNYFKTISVLEIITHKFMYLLYHVLRCFTILI
jgi:hypothetical protein